MMPMCSSRRSPRPFTAGIPPILWTEPGAWSVSAGTGGGPWAGTRGGAGRTGGYRLENPRAPQGPRDWTLGRGPSTWGPVPARGRAALPARSRGQSWGPEAAVVRARPQGTHSHAHVRSAHARTLTVHTVHSRTHVRTRLLTHHTCAHTHPQAEPPGPSGAAWEVGHLTRPRTCTRPGQWAW